MGRIMIKISKFIIVSLVAVFSLTLTGCTEYGEDQLQNSVPSSTVVSGDVAADDDDGIMLPEEEFDADEQDSSGVENSDTTKKDDDGKAS